MDMALSLVWMSMSMFLMSHGTLLIVFEPLRHSRADLNNEKDVLIIIIIIIIIILIIISIGNRMNSSAFRDLWARVMF